MEAYCVWIALQSTITKSIEYPLVATCLSEQQLNSAYSPLLQAALPKMNLVQSFPRAVVFGPSSHQGLGVSHPYVHQMVRHIQEILNQLWRTLYKPSIMRANLEALQLEGGYSKNVFGPEGIDIAWLNTTNTWIGATLQFCRKEKIHISLPFLNLAPQCINDQAIMDVFHNRKFPHADMHRINRCRLFHRGCIYVNPEMILRCINCL